jgi:ectoine hydroxylase-related dioxygenase (phytanoyl-CoA dioxygenase family)
VTRLPAASRPCDVVSVIRRDGGVIIEDFLTADQLDGIRADLLPKVAALPTGGDDFVGRHTRRLSALFAHSRHVADIVVHPLFLGPAQELINTPVTYWSGEHAKVRRPGLRIGATQLIQIGPSEGAQPLHRDDWAFMWRHPGDGREARLQIMIAISDFTADNGGTLVIPGSHTWDDDHVPKRSEAVPTEMGAGSALLWLGSVYHGGGTNRTSDELRTGLTIGLDAANVRQEENMYLALSPAVVKSYPEDIRALLGWAVAEDSYMGWVEIDGRMRSPLELLR